MALFTDAGIQFLLRWIHFLAGITWIGLLYYFNFVQGPFFAEADASTRSVATQKRVARALWWFRSAAAGAARRAFLASRTNVVMSFPMLFFMGAASHFTLGAGGHRGLYGLLLLVVLALLEINALVGTAGPTKKPIETIRGVIVTGIVTAAVMYLIAQAVLGTPAT